MDCEIIKSGRGQVLHIQGHLYYKHSKTKGITKWVCRLRKECSAWVKTTGTRSLEVVRGGLDNSPHSHANNPELAKAKKLLARVKRHGREQRERLPVQTMRELSEAPPEVLSQMPSRDNIRKTIARERLKDAPSNPTSLNDLHSIPDDFQKVQG